MTIKLLVVLAWLAGFGVVTDERPAPPTLARAFSRDGTGMLTLTAEEIVYRGGAPNMKMILHFPLADVRKVERNDALIIIDVGGAGGLNDRPFVMEALDQATAAQFVTAFRELNRGEAAP